MFPVTNDVELEGLDLGSRLGRLLIHLVVVSQLLYLWRLISGNRNVRQNRGGFAKLYRLSCGHESSISDC